MRFKLKTHLFGRKAIYIGFGALTAITSVAYIGLPLKQYYYNAIKLNLKLNDTNDHFIYLDNNSVNQNNTNITPVWQLLRLAEHARDGKIKQWARNTIASTQFTDHQFAQIAQRCDFETCVSLARVPNVNPLLFLPPFKNNSLKLKLENIDSHVLSNINSDHNELLLFILKEAALSNSDCSECNKYFTELAIKNLEDINQHPLDSDHIHTYRPLNEKVNWISLQAISGLISCGTNQCQKLLNNGLFIYLSDLRDRFPDLKIQTWIAQTLANMSVYKETHIHFWHTRWLRVLVEWLHSNHIELSLPAAKILYNLANESNSYLSESLYVLHPIYEEFNGRDFDVIFVHGLLGGAFRTWRQCDAKSSSEDYTRCWPRTWLASDINDIRILAVDYQTHLSNWNVECPSDKFTLKDRSAQLVSNLLLCEIGSKPIIWITHSMGGLLVKQILADMSQSMEPKKKKILEQTKGIIFYSVPHKGSELAVWSPRIQRIISPSSEVLELRKDSKLLLSLHDQFLKLAEHYGIRCLSFGETLKSTVGVKRFKWKALLVPEESSNPNIGKFYLLPVDHYNTCKPMNKSSPSYTLVLDFMKQILSENKSDMKTKTKLTDALNKLFF